MDFAVRCVSCGSNVQQRVRTLDLFSTIYNLWRFPDFTFRRIILAEHKNYTLPVALVEAVGFSYFSMFIVKAGDIYSIDLWRLVVSGFTMAAMIFLPLLYIFSGVCFLVTRASRRGATLNGFISAMIYSLHPIAFGAIILLPAELAVFGPYLFSNNPSPAVINRIPFYSLSLLEIVFASFAIVIAGRFTKLLFGNRKKLSIFAGIFFIFFIAALEIAKKTLVGH